MRVIMKMERVILMGWTALACLGGQVAQAFFDPHIGRWASRDPIGGSGVENMYGFVGGNAIDAWDNLGLDATFPFAVKDLGQQPPHDGKGGETPVEEWVVAAPVDDCTCRDHAHLEAGGHAEVHYWWSTPSSKVHEEHHVALFRMEWDAMKQEIEPYIGGCLRRRVAECHRDLVVAISYFHKMKAFYLNADFDCKEYGNAAPFYRCDSARGYEKDTNKAKRYVDDLTAECSALW